MPEKSKPGASWGRTAGLGMEMVAAVAGCALLGYWWDRHFGTGPWGILGWSAVGIIGGMYNLIRQSMSAFKDDRPGSGKRSGGPKP